MIVDLILDRKDGAEYDAKSFYDDVMEYEAIFELNRSISRALDSGTNKDVQRALCEYIEDNGYNHEIKDFINKVTWVD